MPTPARSGGPRHSIAHPAQAQPLQQPGDTRREHTGGTHGGNTRPRSGNWSSATPGKGRIRGRVTRSLPGPQMPRRGVGPLSRRLSVLRSSAPPGPSVSPPRGQLGDGAALGMTHERHPSCSGDTHATSCEAATCPPSLPGAPGAAPPELPRARRPPAAELELRLVPGDGSAVSPQTRSRDFTPRAGSGYQQQPPFRGSGPSRGWGPWPLFAGLGAVPTRVRGLGAGGGCAWWG